MIINLIILYSYILFCTISIFGYGILFSRFILNTRLNNIGLVGLFGFFLLFAISLLIHFFINLDQYLNLLILLIGFILGILNINLFINIKKYKFYFFFFLLIFLFSILSSKTYADFEWYHLPYINYLNSFKIIFGLVNFSNSYTYGHGWLDILGLFKLPLIDIRGLTAIPIIFYFYFICFFLHELFNSKNLSLKIFSLFTITITFVVFNRLKDFGADIQPIFTTFIFIYYILKYLLENSDKIFLKYIVLFFFFSCVLRIGSVISLPIFLFFILFNIKKYLYDFINYNLKVYIFLFLFFLIFLSKNFITTACFFYPVPFTCFDNKQISWASPKENVYERYEFLSAIAKRWKFYSIQEGELNNKYEYFDKIENNQIMTPKEYNSNSFFWIKYFFHDHDYKRLLNLFVFSLIFFSLSFVVIKKNTNQTDNPKLSYLKFYLLSLICSIILWFIMSPQMRYGGYPLFASLLFFFPSLLYTHNNLTNNKFVLFRNTFLILGIIYFGYKNINETFKDFTNHEFKNFPWPNISQKFENIDFVSENYNGIPINFITKRDDIFDGSPKMCGNVPMPCLPSGRKTCISSISIKHQYIFVSNNNKKCLEHFKKFYWEY